MNPNPITLTCSVCAAQFQWERKGHQRLTCGSDACRRARRAQSVKEKKWRDRGGTVAQQRICLGCGEAFTFERTMGVRGRGPGFCSQECQTMRRRETGLAAMAAHRRRLSQEQRAKARRKAHIAQYGLTQEHYTAMAAEQGHVCRICGQPDAKHHSPLLKIDHDRSCCPRSGSCGKCIRGLLCSNCNTGLGLFGDDIRLLESAIEYLRRADPAARPHALE